MGRGRRERRRSGGETRATGPLLCFRKLSLSVKRL
ncbi:hypothetical protein EYF80_054080 [Liparis tanakae]|uniref:Uncharacterized protein n=1 Tax=Liparis tanakae TaxID=230148 RepID=A0A4Z2F5H7_9TELE|nr:hypothetical protein EYF80_054080 [Liparis tanakae]